VKKHKFCFRLINLMGKCFSSVLHHFWVDCNVWYCCLHVYKCFIRCWSYCLGSSSSPLLSFLCFCYWSLNESTGSSFFYLLQLTKKWWHIDPQVPSPSVEVWNDTCHVLLDMTIQIAIKNYLESSQKTNFQFLHFKNYIVEKYFAFFSKPVFSTHSVIVTRTTLFDFVRSFWNSYLR
jgi:hypothetical protein